MTTIGVVCSVGIGPARGGRSRNEDNYLVCKDRQVQYLDGDREVRQPAGGEGVLLAVADGMGGHDDGHVASTTAARVVAKLYKPGVPKDPSRALLKYVQDAHDRLYWKARDRGPVTMGTTLSICWVIEGVCSWVQVGDSRIYLYRGGQLLPLTPDHTLNEFARRDGRAERVDGEQLAQSFIYGSRGIGDNTRLRLEPGRDSGQVALNQGDRLVLCTDGVWGSVDDVSIADVLRNTPEPQAAAVSLMERAITRGSTDNITVLVARIDSVPSLGVGVDEWEDDGEETIMY